MSDHALHDEPAEQPEIDLDRRKFLTAATAITGAVGAGFMLTPFIASWKPSERARALGLPTELDLSKIEPGQMITTSWRKQQIYVVRRTPEMVASLPKLHAELKDPKSESSEQPEYAKNENRSRRGDVLVLFAVCTHLGCLPKERFASGDAQLGADWPGGFFCPCHGSKFDMAGRVYNGSPAGTNLRVPPYFFKDENNLVIGLDAAPEKGTV